MDWFFQIFKVAKFIAFLAILVMITITLSDIVLRTFGRAVFDMTGIEIPVSVPGVVDIVEAMVIVCAFMAIPYVFVQEKHVGVEIFVEMLDEKTRIACKAFGALLSAIFMGACAISGWGQLKLQWSVGYETPTIGIPIWWFWLAIIVGSAFSAFACVAIFKRNFQMLQKG